MYLQLYFFLVLLHFWIILLQDCTGHYQKVKVFFFTLVIKNIFYTHVCSIKKFVFPCNLCLVVWKYVFIVIEWDSTVCNKGLRRVQPLFVVQNGLEEQNGVCIHRKHKIKLSCYNHFKLSSSQTEGRCPWLLRGQLMLHNFSAEWEIVITAKKREALQEKLLQSSWCPATALPHLSHQCSLPHPSESYSQCPGFLQQNPTYSPTDRCLEMK